MANAGMANADTESTINEMFQSLKFPIDGRSLSMDLKKFAIYPIKANLPSYVPLNKDNQIHNYNYFLIEFDGVRRGTVKLFYENIQLRCTDPFVIDVLATLIKTKLHRNTVTRSRSLRLD